MSLRGRTGDVWTLEEALAALSSAARRAGRPSSVWLAGLFYPPVLLVLGSEVALSATQVVLNRSTSSSDPLHALLLGEGLWPWQLSLVGLAVQVPLFRLVAGLATVSSEETELRTRRLSDVWRAGEGLAVASLGLYLLSFAMLVLAFLVTCGPVFLLLRMLELDSPDVGRMILVPMFGFLGAYLLAVSPLYQLALHSLAQNRRGCGSALLHAWRLVRRDGWATTRALAVDGVTFVLLSAVSFVFGIFSELMCIGGIGTLLVYMPLACILGVARARYWGQAYGALGGAMRADNMPGTKITPATA